MRLHRKIAGNAREQTMPIVTLKTIMRRLPKIRLRIGDNLQAVAKAAS
jgi:hypothetical protein